MKRIISLVCIIALLGSANAFSVQAKRITKKGVYYYTCDGKSTAKYKSNIITVRGNLVKTNNKNTVWKKLKKGKKTFKLSKKVKYYMGGAYSKTRISKSEGMNRLRAFKEKIAVGASMSMYVKNKKIYKIVFAAA